LVDRAAHFTGTRIRFAVEAAHGQIGVNAVTPADVVQAYYAAYNEGRPERLEELVSPDYVDYGHELPGRGPQGARDDYEYALQVAGGRIRYDIEALVAGQDAVAVTWTGHLPNGSDYRGLSLYRVVVERITEVHNIFIDPPPSATA
jgi:ketosteroid isomerase-like protein